jgi:hypothetical protein
MAEAILGEHKLACNIPQHIPDCAGAGWYRLERRAPFTPTACLGRRGYPDLATSKVSRAFSLARIRVPYSLPGGRS